MLFSWKYAFLAFSDTHSISHIHHAHLCPPRPPPLLSLFGRILLSHLTLTFKVCLRAYFHLYPSLVTSLFALILSKSGLFVPSSPSLTSPKYSRLLASCLLDSAFCTPHELHVHSPQWTPQASFPQPAGSQSPHLCESDCCLPSPSSENLWVFLNSTVSFKFHTQSIKKFCRLLLNVPLLSTPCVSGSQISACLRITCWLLTTKLLWVSDSGSSGWGLKFAFLTKSSENAAGPGPYFENHRPIILAAY